MSRDWRKTLLDSAADITAAAELLTSSSMRIVLVVDNENRLLGTVTDGDIRRALMAGHPMSSSVTTAMQKTPVTVSQEDQGRKALQIMREKDLLHLPVLNEEEVVVGLETVRDLLFKEPRPNLVLLMAGGFGKRLYPLTRDIPKPLLPVGEKPILEVILEQLAEEGFSQFVFAVHYHSDQVRAHFGDGAQWGVRIDYLEERQPLGTAGALGLLDHSRIKDPLLVMNGDLLTRLNFGQLLDYHHDRRGSATMCVREYDFQIPYGVVRGDGEQVTDIIEKPVEKYSVNAGIYVLEPEVLDRCQPDQAFDMPSLLHQVINDGHKVNMFPIHEYWLDIGRIEEYERAQVERG